MNEVESRIAFLLRAAQSETHTITSQGFRIEALELTVTQLLGKVNTLTDDLAALKRKLSGRIKGKK